MSRLSINYEHDVYAAVAVAIKTHDDEMIEAIRRVCSGWLESENKKAARDQMLTAVSELIYEAEE